MYPGVVFFHLKTGPAICVSYFEEERAEPSEVGMDVDVIARAAVRNANVNLERRRSLG